MKKLFSIFTTTVLLASVLTIGVSANRGLSYTAPYGTPTIDGKAEPIWDAATWTSVDLPHAKANPTPNTCRVKVMHDDKLVYFLAEVNEKSLGKGDAVEFYFDEDTCKTEDNNNCSVFTQVGVHLDGSANKGSRSKRADTEVVKAHKVTKNGDVYTLEWSATLANGIPAPDTSIGFELMLNDNGTDGKFINALRWNVDTVGGEKGANVSSQNYGKLTFAAKPAATAVTQNTPAPTGSSAATFDVVIPLAALAAASGAAFVVAKRKH